jgi:flagellar protein FliS
MHSAISQYRKLDISSRVDAASPTELIQMLFDGAVGKLQTARGCMGRQDLAGRSAALSSAVSIIEGLQSSLDLDEGGSLANNLNDLYSYMMRKLWEANRHNDIDAVVEVSNLLSTVSDAWRTLKDEVVPLAQEQALPVE